MLNVILDIIMRVKAIGYAVVEVVHDLGFANLRLWKHFVTDPAEKKTSFKNPSADREVYIFADVPHLVKLIRNSFLDSGFFHE